MIIGDRLRAIRESKNLSHGDIQERTGLLRCYISRVENGRTIPSVATLENIARAMKMQLYQVLNDFNVRATMFRASSLSATTTHVNIPIDASGTTEHSK